MTAREAVTQAHIELGMSREEAELRNKVADGFVPDGAALTECLVKPGQERALIEDLKVLFRRMDAYPQAAQAWMKSKMAKRTAAN